MEDDSSIDARPEVSDKAADGPHPALLEGRWVKLTPVGSKDLGFLYKLATDPATGFRWRLRGAVPPPETFEKVVWQSVLTQFIIVSKARNEPIGNVVGYNANPNAGHVAVGIVATPEVVGKGFVLEAFYLFLTHLFAVYSFRKVYLELPSYNLPQFASAEGVLLEREGMLKENDYYGGKYWDSYIFAIWRARWEEFTAQLPIRKTGNVIPDGSLLTALDGDLEAL